MQQKKIIASSDHDFWQLIDSNTTVYNLHKKVYVTADNVFEQHRITPRNFAVAKALCGDNSDNIPGIKGMGFKTAVKLFPMLGSDTDVLLEDVFNYAQSMKGKQKAYDRVLEGKEDVKRNWKLVYLSDTTLSSEQAKKVEAQMERFEPKVNKIGLMRDLIKNGINDFDIDGFVYSFNCIEGLKHV
jgi:5'-3' exonuclease